MTGLLAAPIGKCFGGNRIRKTFLAYYNAGIVCICSLVHKQIIIARIDVIVRGKSFVLKEQFFFVRQVSAHTHIRFIYESERKVMQAYGKRIETNEPV